MTEVLSVHHFLPSLGMMFLLLVEFAIDAQVCFELTCSRHLLVVQEHKKYRRGIEGVWGGDKRLSGSIFYKS